MLRSMTISSIIFALFTISNMHTTEGFDPSLHEVFNKETNIHFKMDLLQDHDGNTYALKFILRKGPEVEDVILRISQDLAAFVMISITDDKGNILSKSPQKISAHRKQRQKVSFIRVSETSAHEWLIPVSSTLKSQEILQGEVKGRVVVSFAFSYSRVTKDQQTAEAAFEHRLISLHDANLKFVTTPTTKR